MLRSIPCQGEWHGVGSGSGRLEQGANVRGTGPGRGKGRGRRNRGKKQREEGEKSMLVGDVQEYWGFYAGEYADPVWDLKY